MNYLFCQASLFLWLPMVVMFFVIMPPRKAVIVAYVSAWLALPNISFDLPGMPDYTKMTATVVGILPCIFIFDQRRAFSLRFRWYDIPMAGFCGCSFVSAISNGLGAYEGFSATLDTTVSWGLPYLIGRIYFTDLEGVRDLAIGIVVGGLAYIPPCLFEIRFSPLLHTWVYGLIRYEGMRFGGYRPKVFLATGLELGMWMTNASLLCFQLWYCGTVKTIRNLRIGMLTLAMFAVTILCKSTGALVLMVFGLGVLQVSKLTGRTWAIWLMLAIAPAYSLSRGFNVWSGRHIIEITTATVGGERAQSYEYRLYMENMLAGRAMERPVFGWGRFNRFMVHNSKGKVLTVPDGYWILALGGNGLVGLGMLLAMMSLPMVIVVLRFPVKTWTDPRVGPAVGLALVLALMMIDFLSNAMLNPVYAMVMGAIVGLPPVRLGGHLREAEARLAHASELMREGRIGQAEGAFRQAIDLASDGDDLDVRRVQAEALDGLGHSLMAGGHLADAELAFREALIVRDWLAATTNDPARFRDLAIAREGLGRALIEMGRVGEAIEERQIALQIWEILAADHPRDAEYREHRLASLNDLAWLLATTDHPGLADPDRAIQLAETAAGESPDRVASWNTLGVARYRAGDWPGAIEALEHSAISSDDRQGTAFDHYFLAMAWARLQRDDLAREWLDRGIAWSARYRPGHPALERFRDEAEGTLAVEGDGSGTGVVKV